MPNPEKLRQYKIYRRIIQGLVLLVIAAMAFAKIQPENDIYWQLKIGEIIIKNHHFPTTDPFNLTNPHAVWTLEEWLVEVIFYLLQTHFGWNALIFLKIAVVVATFCMLVFIMNRMKANLYVGLIFLFLTALVNTRGYWSVFPSLFEYFFIILAFLGFELYRDGKIKWWPWCLPVFSLVWANAHASFFLLEGIAVAYIFGSFFGRWWKLRYPSFSPVGGLLTISQIKSLTIATTLSLVAPILSPNGINTWLYPFIISSAKFSTTYVNEYISLPHYIGFIWGTPEILLSAVLFLVTFGFLIYSWRRVNPIDIGLFLLFSYLGARAMRHLAIFILIMFLVLLRYLSFWFREYRGWFRRTLLKDVLCVLIILSFAVWYKTTIVHFGLGIDMSAFPVKAAEFINSNNIAGNMFNHYNYGGFLIWEMPKYQVFIDGRLEMYLGQAGEDYLRLLEARPGWQTIIDKYHINFFLNYADTPITFQLLQNDDWRLLYFDDTYVVFVKNTPQNHEVIAKNYDKDLAMVYKQMFMSTIYKRSSQQWNQDGLMSVRSGNVKQSISQFERAVQLDPENFSAVYNLAQAYTQDGRFREAYETYRLARLIQPMNLIVQGRLGNLKKMLGL